MALPVRAASTVEKSLARHSSQRGAAAPRVAPAGDAAEAVPAPDPLLVVAGVAMPALVGAFEVVAPSTGVAVETPAAPKVVARTLPDSGEAAVVGEPVVTARLLPAEPSCSDEIEPGSAVVVVVDPAVAAPAAGDGTRLLAGKPLVCACAAGTTQHRQRSAVRRADRCRDVDITGMLSPVAVTVQTAYVRCRSRTPCSFAR